ncbi:hypothetical protein Purlil1_13360 [Purpureocillium lilacinum]|uniref:Uncharacterized protein n=1 Tax=Purpureocillium lilacinum TaxID=33203 RepID=A0ABR0BEB6_PURLI|nr:hypothetical protein Purlil1_13360 [Purpureocillium lilacinum]
MLPPLSDEVSVIVVGRLATQPPRCTFEFRLSLWLAKPPLTAGLMSIEAGQSALAPVTFRVKCSTHPPCPPSPSPQPEVPLSDTHRPIPFCVDSALIVGAVVEGRAHSPCPPSKPSVDWPARQHSPCPGGQHTIAMPLNPLSGMLLQRTR